MYVQKNFKGIIEPNIEERVEKVIVPKVRSLEQQIETTKNIAQQSAKKAEKAARQATENAEKQASAKMAETSVTVLSIFSGIIITIVAGLTFSASVLQNISSASIYRLVFIAALIGFVCINMLFVMFHYIERFRHPVCTECKTIKVTTVRFPHSKAHSFSRAHDFCRICKRFFAKFGFCFIINIILLAIMAGVFVHWKCGTVEKRNDNIKAECVISDNSPYYEVLF